MPDERVVALPLERGGAAAAGLLVGLRRHPVEQLVRQLRDVHELRPRPLQRRPELREEVPHPRLAARDPVREERAHEGPAEPRPVADRVVDLGDGRDLVVHEPERLAPERLEQPVGDEAVDLVPHDERMHPDRAVRLGRTGDGLRARQLAAAELDERQQVDGVERMADDEALGPVDAGLQLARPQTRGGGAEERVVGRRAGRLRQERLFQLEALRRRLLDEVGACGGLCGGADELERPLRGQRRERQPAVGPARVRDRLADLALRLRVGVVEPDVDAVEDEPRRPAGADHAAAEQPHRAGALSHASAARASREPRRVRARARSSPRGS